MIIIRLIFPFFMVNTFYSVMLLPIPMLSCFSRLIVWFSITTSEHFVHYGRAMRVAPEISLCLVDCWILWKVFALYSEFLSPAKRFFFLGSFSSHKLRVEGQRMSFTEQIVKPTEVIMILGFINRINLIWISKIEYSYVSSCHRSQNI